MIEELRVVNELEKCQHHQCLYTMRETLSKGEEENPANIKLLSGASTGTFWSEVRPTLNSLLLQWLCFLFYDVLE